MQFSNKTIGVLAALITVFIWSSFIVVSRATMHSTLTPFDVGFLRFVGAGAVMLPWGYWWLRRERAQHPDKIIPGWLGLSPYPFHITATVGVFSGLLYSCLAYSGFFFAPAAHASALMPGLLPLWTALLAAWILGTVISPLRALGLALMVGGGLLVGGASLLRAFEGGDVWKGDLMFMAASFSWACYTVYARKHALSAIPTTIALSVFAAVTYVPLYAVLASVGLITSHLIQAPWSEIFFQIFVQGIGSVVISGITFVRMVETFGPVRSTMVTATVPILSALGAVIFLGEPLYLNLVAGLILVTLGMVMGARVNPQTTKKS